MNINNIIVKKANSFIGQKEIKGNLGFLDKEFQEQMETIGWMKTHAWCAYFTELVWKLAYAEIDSTQVTKLSHLFSGSVMQTWVNFNNSLEFETSNIPKAGSLIVWQSYKNNESTTQGHIGIVDSIIHKVIYAIEGNTNDNGSREGIKVAKKIRNLDFGTPRYGLKLLGFIHPLQV
jgi:hypothetical protein